MSLVKSDQLVCCEKQAVSRTTDDSAIPNIITGDNWAFRGESIWAILHKLAFLNEFSAREVVRCFGSSETRERSYLRVKERDLRSPDGFDLQKISSAVGLSVDDLNMSFYNYYSPDRSSRGVALLRYCSECIKNGIHVTLHQSPALLACPWHDKLLTTACPSCGRSQSYQLDHENLSHPYACSCGYQYWPGIEETPWTKTFSKSQENDIIEFLQWIEPVRTARELRGNRLILLENNSTEKTVDSVLFKLNRIYPGPAWLHRCLGDPVIQDKYHSTRMKCTNNHNVHEAQEDSWRQFQIKIESLIENPKETFFVNHVLESAQSEINRLKCQIQRIFLKNHERCRNEVVFVNEQLYTANRSGSACLWASAYAMWERSTSHLFEKALVTVPMEDGIQIPADQLGLYLKWQHMLRVFERDQKETIDKDSLDLLVKVYLRWLRIYLSQEYLHCVDMVYQIVKPHNILVLDGELRFFLESLNPSTYYRPLGIATIIPEPLAITLEVACYYSAIEAAHASRLSCTKEPFNESYKITSTRRTYEVRAD